MLPIIFIQITGKGILTALAILAVTALIVGAVWLFIGPLTALVTAVIIAASIRGLLRLFRL